MTFSRNRSMQSVIPVLPLGVALSGLLGISFIICVLGYLLFPDLPIAHSALPLFLPGFTLLSWSSFCLGLFESIAWGWYIALVFAPLYNFAAACFPARGP